MTAWQRGLRLAGNLHILLIHFPIALILVAGFFEGIGWTWNAPKFLVAARLNFTLGAAGAVVAASLGWIAAAHSHYTGEAATALEWHRWLGTSVAALSTIGIACIMAEKFKKPIGTRGLRLILVILSVLILATAHFGGTLIYGPNHLIP